MPNIFALFVSFCQYVGLVKMAVMVITFYGLLAVPRSLAPVLSERSDKLSRALMHKI